MKSWEHDKMVYDDGVQQGIEIGIQGMIQSAQTFKIPKEQVLTQLQHQYDLDPVRAEAYLKKCWQE